MKTGKVFPRTHISLYVSDITNTVQFYDRFFDQSADKVKEDYAKYELNSPPLTISFLQNPEKVNAEAGHYGIQVENKEKLEQLLAIAKERQLVKYEEVETACCYAVQDKFWVNDPDGYEWEVYQFLEDSDLKKEESKVGTACC